MLNRTLLLAKNVALVLTFFSLILWNQLAHACKPENQVPDEFLVRLKKDSGVSSFGLGSPTMSSFVSKLESGDSYKVLHDNNASQAKVFTLESKEEIPPTILSVKMPGMTVEGLESDPDVLSAEPNCYVDLFVTPNDTFFGSQTYHTTISSTTGWDTTTGSTDVIIAISDTGVDYNHSDLSANMHRNTAENSGSSNVDDDGNGFTDDIFGFDFSGSNDSDPFPGTGSSAAHGTHVAGIAAAVGNNGTGVAGVAWTARIMALKGFSDSGSSGTISDLLETVFYAADNGARVLNASWGSSSSPSTTEIEAFQYAINKGVVSIVAAGNSTSDASSFSPAGIEDVITVASSSNSDTLSTFSNFGSVIDIMAPGGDSPSGSLGSSEFILSTFPTSEGSFGSFRGTSMAAPVVAGLAALILSVNPSLTVAQVRNVLRNNADLVNVTAANASGSTFTYPRVNVAAAVQNASDTSAASVDTLCVNQGLCAVASGSSSSSSFSSDSGGGGCGFNQSFAATSPGQLSLILLLLLAPLALLNWFRSKK